LEEKPTWGGEDNRKIVKNGKKELFNEGEKKSKSKKGRGK